MSKPISLPGSRRSRSARPPSCARRSAARATASSARKRTSATPRPRNKPLPICRWRRSTARNDRSAGQRPFAQNGSPCCARINLSIASKPARRCSASRTPNGGSTTATRPTRSCSPRQGWLRLPAEPASSPHSSAARASCRQAASCGGARGRSQPRRASG